MGVWRLEGLYVKFRRAAIICCNLCVNVREYAMAVLVAVNDKVS